MTYNKPIETVEIETQCLWHRMNLSMGNKPLLAVVDIAEPNGLADFIVQNLAQRHHHKAEFVHQLKIDVGDIGGEPREWHDEITRRGGAKLDTAALDQFVATIKEQENAN